jgi:hypothetical protein
VRGYVRHLVDHRELQQRNNVSLPTNVRRHTSRNYFEINYSHKRRFKALPPSSSTLMWKKACSLASSASLKS